MPQSITNNFNIYNAEQFIESLSGDNRLYLSIGRPQTWTNENSPPAVVDAKYSDVEYSSETIALKRIIRADVRQVVPRYNWTSGQIYAKYNSKDNLIFTKKFYVLTYPENNVYKCISNNNNVASTIKPTGRSTSFITTADGYVWKFLYTLSDTVLLKFFTTDYMGVDENPDVSSITIPGTIDTISITNPGNNFISANNIVVSINGDGQGAAVGNVALNASKSIGTISLASIGRDYTYAEV